MNRHKPKSTREEFEMRRGKMASVRDAAHYADMAGRHYAKDKITRVEAQMMIDAAVGSPWALFMAWCRHTLRTVTGAKRRMEEQLRAARNEERAIEEEVSDQLDPAMNDNVIGIDEPSPDDAIAGPDDDMPDLRPASREGALLAFNELEATRPDNRASKIIRSAR